MPDVYNAGKASISLDLNLRNLDQALVKLTASFDAVGKDSASTFQKSFNRHIKTESIASEISNNLIASFKAKKPGDKIGQIFFRSLKPGFTKVALGGVIGLALDGVVSIIRASYREVTKEQRIAEQAAMRHNAELDIFRRNAQSISDVLNRYNGITQSHVDLLGLASGQVDTLTGKYRTLLDTLNELSTSEIRITLETIEQESARLESIIQDKKNAIQRRPEERLSQGNNTFTLRNSEFEELNKNDQLDVFFLEANLQILEKQKQEALDLKSILEEANQVLFADSQELFNLRNQLEVAVNEGNNADIRSLEDKIRRLEFISKLINLGIVDNRKDAETEADRLLNSFRNAQNRGRRKDERNKQIEEAKRLFEESQTPVERYRAELEKLNDIKFDPDPERFNLIGGTEGLERQLAQDLIELASRTKDNALAKAELDKRVSENNISTERAIELTKELADVSGRTAEIQNARSFKQSAATPLESLRSELDAINAKEAEFLADGQLYTEAGGDITFIRNRIAAIEDYARSSGETETAIVALVQEFNAGRISAEAFGQSFQDITDGTESAGSALQRLGGLSGSITPDAIAAAEQSIKNSVDYQQDLNDEKLRELEINLARAQASGDKDEIVDLENQIRLLERKNELKGLGLTEQEASDLAPELIKNEELAELQGRVKNTFSGAFRAAMNGNFDDFLQNKLQNAAANMFDQALDSLLNSLFSALGNLNLGGGAGGQAGGLFGGLASIFAGLFADGGTIPRGQFGIVGEAGPELAFAGSAPVSIVPFDPVTPGRRSVADLSGGGRVNNSSVVMNIQTPDARSFRKSQATIESDMALAQRRAARDL